MVSANSERTNRVLDAKARTIGVRLEFYRTRFDIYTIIYMLMFPIIALIGSNRPADPSAPMTC